MSMKHILPTLGLILLFGLMLLFPQVVFTGASEGLLLWFNTVLPTLLPFIILTNLMLHSQAIDWITRLVYPILCRIFRVSTYGSFAVLAGFLCGYPMGSKVTADLLRNRKITYNEACYLLSFCNNTSPMFILSYVIWQNLKAWEQSVQFIVILILSPVLCSFVFRYYYTSLHFSKIVKKENSSTMEKELSSVSGDLLDSSIMNGFETITRVGGYIILFSILLNFAEILPLPQEMAATVALASLEISSGIPMLCTMQVSPVIKIILTLGLTSFGGWCAIAQTRAMIQGTGLPVIPYIIEKLVTTLVTSLLTYCYLILI